MNIMTDAHFKHVNSVVNQTISNYQLTSKSKSYCRLTKRNSEKITKAVLERKDDNHLLDLIKKRDYYTRKIHELLNSSGEQTTPYLIDDEAEAEHYIRKRLLRDHVKVEQIKSLIQKHKRFQETASQELDQISRKHSGNRSSIGGLKKFDSMNAAANAKAQSEKETALKQLYASLLERQRDYSIESESMLKHLDVPFFNSTLDHVTASQKSFVLELLYKCLAEP